MWQKVLNRYDNHIQLADTKTFVDKLLPVSPERVNSIFVELQKDGVYTETKQWEHFPDDLEHEGYEDGTFFNHFVNIANKIAEVAKTTEASEEQVREAQWVEYHIRVLQPQSKGESNNRPDCLLALNSLARDIGYYNMQASS